MIPLYSQQEFDSAKSHDPLPLQCLQCGARFLKNKEKVVQALNPESEVKANFCSNSCGQTYQGPPSSVECRQCGVTFLKPASQVRKSPNHFCNRSCAAKYNNTHKSSGCRVSKLERWLQDRLVSKYPELEFHFNRKDSIEGELDIYIPSMRLAFELNGIFHYEPIHGTEKLSSIQENDHRKFQACLERGIELCLIDVSSMNYFKESKAHRFLEIVQNVIDQSPLPGSNW